MSTHVGLCSLVPRPSTPPVFDRLQTISDQNRRCRRSENETAYVYSHSIGTHSLYLDKSDVEHQGRVGGDDLPHPPLPIAEVGRDSDPASLP